MPSSIFRITISFVLSFIVTHSFATETVEEGFARAAVELGYESVDVEPGSPVAFVRRGNGADELRAAVPEHKFDDTFLEDWFFEDTVGVLSILLVTLPENINSDALAHDFLADELRAQWGNYSFSIYDPNTGVSRFVNYAGAFVALSWVRLDDVLAVVDSQDLVQVLVVEEEMGPDSSDTDELWQFFKMAANSEDVDRLLSRIKSTHMDSAPKDDS